MKKNIWKLELESLHTRLEAIYTVLDAKVEKDIGDSKWELIVLARMDVARAIAALEAYLEG